MKWVVWTLGGLGTALYVGIAGIAFLYARSAHNSVCKSILFGLRWPQEAIQMYLRER